jgi:hypothetical protein
MKLLLVTKCGLINNDSDPEAHIGRVDSDSETHRLGHIPTAVHDHAADTPAGSALLSPGVVGHNLNPTET